MAVGLAVAVPTAEAAEVAPGAGIATKENAVKYGLPLTKKVGNKTLTCTYTSPTLHGGSTGHTVWNGGNGELVSVTNYVQRITSPDCDPVSVRSATNWDCFKNGLRANCGATLLHNVERSDGSQFGSTAYDCSNSPPDACFGSSGTDGKHTTYSVWVVASSWSIARSHLFVYEVVVVGVSSGSNHHSTSAWANV
jgi:hypothetical protein